MRTLFKMVKGADTKLFLTESVVGIYEKRGYVLTETLHVNDEEVSEITRNFKLNLLLNSYLENESLRRDTIVKFGNSEIHRDLFFDTMRKIDNDKWTLLCDIEKLVDHLILAGLNVQNEMALQLYDALHGNNSLMVLLS